MRGGRKIVRVLMVCYWDLEKVSLGRQDGPKPMSAADHHTIEQRLRGRDSPIAVNRFVSQWDADR